ncbi:hypothetical protein ACT3S7_12205 [Corynebacterium sp. AOP34-AQ2-28]|uniref:hypothetical protein n=1 Tax=Corynebacterium sp. AOP34-AQ2-28 TaxID=3457689 RepID=UPI004034E681
MANANDDRRRANRGARITIRLTEGESGEVKAFADSHGIKPSALARAAVLDVVGTGAVPRAVAAAVETGTTVSGVDAADRRSELAELTAATDAVGGPLNVIVRAVHSGETAVIPDPGGLVGVEDVLVDVRDVLVRVRGWVVAHEATAGGLRELTTAVNRVANNLGQLSYKIGADEVDYLDGLDDAATVSAVLSEVQGVLGDVQGRLGARVATPDGLKLQRVLSELNKVTAENRKLRKQLSGTQS